MLKKRKSYIVLYVICTYALFWFMFLIIGVIGPSRIKQINGLIESIYIVGSWVPTIVLLIMFKKIIPDITVIGFYKNAFKKRIDWLLVSIITMILVAVYFISVYLISMKNGVMLSSMFEISVPAFIYYFFDTLITGPTGEESGWRGFLLPSIEKKAGVIKGSIIVGVIWACWHAPLWFLEYDFAGLKLVVYIVTFMIFAVSRTVIMGIIYNHCHNLFIPMWIHFIFNFILRFYIGEYFDLQIWQALFYTITALGLICWHKDELQRKKGLNRSTECF